MPMGIKALVAGCKGTALSSGEKEFFHNERPWGFIVFARNIESPAQLADLISQFRQCVDRHSAPVFVDQEGGRVRRLRPPHWPDYCNGQILGDIYQRSLKDGIRAAWLHSRLMAHDIDRKSVV